MVIDAGRKYTLSIELSEDELGYLIDELEGVFNRYAHEDALGDIGSVIELKNTITLAVTNS